MTHNQFVDVVVIGAGPAGSTAACRLAQMGHRVVIIERHAFPRPHVGESLPIKVLQLLQSIGADQLIESAGFLRSSRALVKWAYGNEHSLYMMGNGEYLQVERSVFDHLLLEYAKASGVGVIQRARAKIDYSTRGYWTVTANDHRYRCPVLIDASGSRGLRTKRIRHSAPTLALYGYFVSDPSVTQESRVEALADSWIWSSTLANGQTAAALFCDPDWIRINGSTTLEGLLRKQLEASTLMCHLKEQPLSAPVLACDASVKRATDPVSNGLVRIGDASLSLDPLSSQGGVMAISSALQGAIIANTLLCHPERKDLVEAFATLNQQSRLKQHLRTTSAFYREKLEDSNHTFWLRRCVTSTENVIRAPLQSAEHSVTLSKEAHLGTFPVIRKDMICEDVALHHPQLDGPIAFVRGFHVSSLLDCLEDTPSASQLLERWAARVGEVAAIELFTKFWQTGIILQFNSSTGSYNAHI